MEKEGNSRVMAKAVHKISKALMYAQPFG